MKSIFSENQDIDKTAFVNWRMHDDHILNMLNMADGFLTAAIQLGEISLHDNTYKLADITVFAMLTNANHGIELYLKAMTWSLNEIIGNQIRIEGGHDIEQIYRTVRSRIRHYDGQISIQEFNLQTAQLKVYIDELFSKIRTKKSDNMDFSRYPLNQKYDPHFYVVQAGNVTVDLENFVSRFREIHGKLKVMSEFLFHQELNQDW